jgi:hypothetical protein
MGTLAGILQVIGLLYTLDKQAEEIYKKIQQHSDETWFKDSGETFQKLRAATAAKNSQELEDASKRLANLFGRLG